jgi:uncharacterized delta-60 repeat protein
MDAPAGRRLLTVSLLALVSLLVLTGVGRAAQPGTIDRGFGTNGEVPLVVEGQSLQPAALAVRPDGKLLVVGTLGAGRPTELVVVRLLADGTRDAAYGSDGVVRTALPWWVEIEAAALEPGGGLVLAGAVGAGDGTTDAAGAVVRLLADGSIDRGFGTDGLAKVDVPGTGAGFLTVALQTDGSILAGGSDGFTHRGQTSATLTRLTPAGILDPSFMAQGVGTPRGAAVGALLPWGGARLALSMGSPYDRDVDKETFVTALAVRPGAMPTSSGTDVYTSERWFGLGPPIATPLPGRQALAVVPAWKGPSMRKLVLLRLDSSLKLRRSAVLDGHGVQLVRVDPDTLRLDRSFGRGGRSLVQLRGLQRLMDAAVLQDGSVLLLAQRPTWVRPAGAEATLTRVAGGADRAAPRVALVVRGCVHGRRIVRIGVRDAGRHDRVVVRRNGRVVLRARRAPSTLRVRADRRVRLTVEARDAAGNVGVARRLLGPCR